jgi:hypothetical protein
VNETPQTEPFADYLSSGDKWRWWGVSSFVIRRDAFQAAGGFASRHTNGEDADLALRLGVVPGFIQITTPATFAYREHRDSASNDVGRTLAGALSQVRAEKVGHYPGGKARARERREILTRHTRPVALEGLKNGFRREAWQLYFATFATNASVGRVKYLAAFPFIALIKELSWRYR